MIKKKAGGGYRLAVDPMPPVDIMQGRYESLMCAIVERAYKDLLGIDLKWLSTCDIDSIKNNAYDFFASGRCKEYADIDGWRVIRHAKSKRQGASIRAGSKKAKATV